VEGSLKTGELVRVLPDYSQPADVWAVCRTRLSQSAKLKTCVSFLQEQLTNGPYALISSGIPH
jgi:LysR family transcriptional activator of dmlA